MSKPTVQHCASAERAPEEVAATHVASPGTLHDRALMQAAFSKDQVLVQGVELYLLAVVSLEGSAEVLLEV